MSKQKEKKTYRFTMPLWLKLTDQPRVAKRNTSKQKIGDIIQPKIYHLNMNNYPQWFNHIRNDLKQLYTEIAMKQLVGVEMSTPIKLTFIHYRPDNRKSDRANVCCIHEKFFSDALTKAGCIPDDNDKYILETRYLSGGVQRGKGRMEIIVEEV